MHTAFIGAKGNGKFTARTLRSLRQNLLQKRTKQTKGMRRSGFYVALRTLSFVTFVTFCKNLLCFVIFGSFLCRYLLCRFDLLLRNERRASSAWPRFERRFRDSAQHFRAGAIESLNAHPLNDGAIETGQAAQYRCPGAAHRS